MLSKASLLLNAPYCEDREAVHDKPPNRDSHLPVHGY